jgi:RNA polymerase sigma-70 factor (ECF subfamily)
VDFDEPALVRRAALEDDRAAFSQLVRLHQSGLRNFMRRLTRENHALADELAQDAFVKAWFALKRHKLDSSFRSWLYSIAYRSFLDHCRRNRRPIEPLDEAILLEAGESSAGSGGSQVDYETAMKLLKPDEVTLVELHYRKGLTHSELAETLNMPLGSVKTKIRAVLQRLSTRLQESMP